MKQNVRFFFQILIIILFFTQAETTSGQSTVEKPRLIVLTDISSLSQTEGEPDDGQSLVRLMLYTNELALEGLIATSNLGHGQRTRAALIHQVINAYGQVHPNLLLHDRNYPSPDQLRQLVKSGQPIAGPKVPVEASIGEGKDTEGSEWIIRVVDKPDPRPVWVTVWGGSADLAQALWKVKATRTDDEVRKFVSKLRTHFVYDQDTTGPWIRATFPDLFCILRHHGIRGMYRGGDTTLVRSRWVEINIRNHGALGDLYVNYRGGDVWTTQLGRVSGIKEGDTPSFLFLLKNGLNDPEHPEWGNWGGRFTNNKTMSQLWVEAVDSVANYQTDMDPRMAALYRWRPAWQADFAARLDWCVEPFRGANHAPKIEQSPVRMNAKSGATVKLSTRAVDPDKHALQYSWYFYRGEGTYAGKLPPLTSQGKRASFIAPPVTVPQTINVILEVKDDGTPALTAYKRFIILVRP